MNKVVERRDMASGAPDDPLWLGRFSSPGQPEQPLRLLFIGHNPSQAAWTTGHYYANPSNRFWSLLRRFGIISEGMSTPPDWELPSLAGIGFCDLGRVPGNDSSVFGRDVLREWREDLFERLAGHAQRAGAPPQMVAFTGKRQWKVLFDPHLSRCEHGPQPDGLRPERWPLSTSAVWVLPSSSGRAAMSDEQRSHPYNELSRSLQCCDR